MIFGPYPATLLRVIDGDSIVVSVDLGFHVSLQDQVVRIAHIDAPEVATVEGKAAREFARSLLKPGMLLRLASHSLDKYGRVLGTVGFPGDAGQNPDWHEWPDFGETMIATGHARQYEGGLR